jgi:hypothetical protein
MLRSRTKCRSIMVLVQVRKAGKPSSPATDPLDAGVLSITQIHAGSAA